MTDALPWRRLRWRERAAESVTGSVLAEWLARQHVTHLLIRYELACGIDHDFVDRRAPFANN
jgi:hypothetical protein